MIHCQKKTVKKILKSGLVTGKVVDDKGNPLVVYHGTNKDFTEFKKDNFTSGAFGKGFYFSPSKESSEIYAKQKGGGKIMDVYLSIQNPYTINDGDNLGGK